MRLRLIVIGQLFLLLTLNAVGLVPTRLRAADLVIDRVTVAEQSSTSQGGTMKINWFTSLEADGRIDYGITSSYGYHIVSSLPPNLNHEIILGGLKGETTYHFKISSTTPFGQQMESFDQTFKTSKFKSITSPVISGGRVSYVGGSYFIVTWFTDVKSDSKVEYSTDQKLVRPARAGGQGDVTAHEVLIRSLKPAIVYWYRVKSRDRDGNEAAWDGYSVTTASSTADEKDPLAITQVSPVSSPDTLISDTTVTFHWRTNRPARGWVDLRSKKKGSKRVNEGGFYRIEHEFTVTGLVPATVYITKLQATDIFGKSVTTGEVSLATSGLTSSSGFVSSSGGGVSCGQTYAYGVSCRDLAAERNLAGDLRELLSSAFSGRTPSAALRNWYTLVKAYVYGGYPMEAIVKAVKFGGKTVHPAIPWSAWKDSADYKEYINR
ncbi:MAG: hypothetical protein HY974_02300 [Candidatus Kerfeldbacteria bacterium]|nr:hypothetical protein [Candidatus Kerfeldbacteria bacterium]